MENLKAMSSPQPTGNWNGSERLTNDRAEYAMERARTMFGCYRKGDAHDPDTYVAAVAAVLAEYPDDTIWTVTDPRAGLPSKVGWLPTVKEVRDACEAHYGPTRRAAELEAQARKQLAERKQLAITDGRPRKTYEELVADCQARGLNIGPKQPSVQAIDSFLAEHGVSREAFDAMPDLPKDIGVKR
jgi:hypothetical protein